MTTLALTRSIIHVGLLWLSFRLAASLEQSPASWAVWSLCVWLLYVNTRGWGQLTIWDRRHLLWGTASMVCFLHFLYWDPSFKVCSPRLYLYTIRVPPDRATHPFNLHRAGVTCTTFAGSAFSTARVTFVGTCRAGARLPCCGALSSLLYSACTNSSSSLGLMGCYQV